MEEEQSILRNSMQMKYAAQVNLIYKVSCLLQPYKFRDDLLVIGYTNGNIQFFDLNSKVIEHDLINHSSSVISLINPYLAYNSLLISATTLIINFWDMKTRCMIKTLSSFYEITNMLYFPEYSDDMFISTHFSHIRFWNISIHFDVDTKMILEFEFLNYNAQNTSTDSSLIIKNNYLEGKNQYSEVVYKRHKTNVLCVLVSNRIKLIITGGSDADIHVTDLLNKPIKIITEHERGVHILTDINGEAFASASEDRMIKIWSYSNIEQSLITLEPFKYCACSFLTPLNDIFEGEKVIQIGSSEGHSYVLNIDKKMYISKVKHSNSVGQGIIFKDPSSVSRAFQDFSDNVYKHSGVYLENGFSLIFYRIEKA